MFKRILIANRGEAAVRILRTCRELGIETSVVYSEVDRETLPVRLADHAVCIGPAPEADSYRNVPRILSAAEITGSEAIHPGYGFLAENADFAEAVEACHLKFVGPRSETIRQAGDRLTMRRLVKGLGIPVLPGNDEEIAGAIEARQQAATLGFPLLLRPAARTEKSWLVRHEKDFETTLRLAQAEARALLGDARLYLLHYIEHARVIDVPFLRDAQGAVIALPEIENSIQHRYQRILTEAPSPLATDTLRRQLSEWTVATAQALDFVNAGAVEFVAHPAGQCYFLGVRACLEAGHPVSEVVTGRDLVADQLRIAAGEPVSSEVSPGCPGARHVIMCRVRAEDYEREFMPTSGIVTGLRWPGGPGVRIDTHTFAGYRGSAHYDTLVGKITVWDEDRERAIARMERALHETAIEGVKTTLEFLQKVMRLGAFRKGEISVTLVDREILGLH